MLRGEPPMELLSRQLWWADPLAALVLVWWIRMQLPESPRWLAQNGRMEEAERVLAELEARVAMEAGFRLPSDPSQQTGSHGRM